MVREAVLLAVWLLGLFALVGLVAVCTWRMVKRDSFAYDEEHVWRRKT